MSDIPESHVEVILIQTGFKTTNQYIRMRCDICKEVVFLTHAEFKIQMADVSENNWKCPKCGTRKCHVDYEYSSRMLAQ